MATIVNRGKRQWQVKVRRKGYPTETKTFDTKKEAEEWAAIVEGKMAACEYVDMRAASKTTLRQVFERYLEEVVPYRKGVQLGYMVRAWMERDLADRIIGGITSADIKRWLRKRSSETYTVYEWEAGRRRHKLDADGKPVIRYTKTVSGKTVLNEFRTLSAVFSFAQDTMGMKGLGNPCKTIPPHDRPQYKFRTRRLQGDEYDRLLAACEADQNPYLAAVFVFCVESAARRSEAVNLKWAGVDLENGTALFLDTKNSDDRTIGLSPKAIELLSKLPSRPHPGEPVGERLVFPVSADSITRAFGRARKRCGIKGSRESLDGMTFHDQRHEATSRLVEEGFHILEVMAQTGHRSTESLKRYVHPKATNIPAKLAKIRGGQSVPNQEEQAA